MRQASELMWLCFALHFGEVQKIFAKNKNEYWIFLPTQGLLDLFHSGSLPLSIMGSVAIYL